MVMSRLKLGLLLMNKLLKLWSIWKEGTNSTSKIYQNFNLLENGLFGDQTYLIFYPSLWNLSTDIAILDAGQQFSLTRVQKIQRLLV